MKAHLLALVVVALLAVGCDDPDGCDPTCPETDCGETGACNGE